MAEKKTREQDPIYAYWRARHKAEHDQCEQYMLRTVFNTDTVENPQCGLWKIQLGGGYKDGVKQEKYWKPLQIWLSPKGDPNTKSKIWEPGLVLYGYLDIDQLVDQDRILDLWGRHKEHLKTATRDAYAANGKRWDHEPPPKSAVASAASPPEPSVPRQDAGVAASGGSAERGPGDNSKDLETFRKMKADVEDDLGTLEAAIKSKPIKSLDDANRYEEWANRVAKSVTEMGKQHRAEKQPFLDKCREIDERWLRTMEKLTARRVAVKDTVDAWARAENARRQKEAQEKAAAELAAERERQEKERQEAIAHNQAAADANAELEKTDLIGFLTGSKEELVEVPPAPDMTPVAPVVAVEAVQVGVGRKRTVKATAPKIAVITNLAAAAAHLAALNDPDLIKIVQKKADAAAKVGAEYPGCKLTDATQGAAA